MNEEEYQSMLASILSCYSKARLPDLYDLVTWHLENGGEVDSKILLFLLEEMKRPKNLSPSRKYDRKALNKIDAISNFQAWLVFGQNIEPAEIGEGKEKGLINDWIATLRDREVLNEFEQNLADKYWHDNAPDTGDPDDSYKLMNKAILKYGDKKIIEKFYLKKEDKEQ